MPVRATAAMPVRASPEAEARAYAPSAGQSGQSFRPRCRDGLVLQAPKGRRGGAVYWGTRFMLAVEFNAPARAGRAAIEEDMVYVGKNPQARAMVQARRCGSAKELSAAFLRGEEFEYMEVDEASFFDLLKRYKRGSKTEGLIDMGSGLRMYNVTLIR